MEQTRKYSQIAILCQGRQENRHAGKNITSLMEVMRKSGATKTAADAVEL